MKKEENLLVWTSCMEFTHSCKAECEKLKAKNRALDTSAVALQEQQV